MKIKKNQEINLAIEKVAFGGQGIGRVDDFVIFVDKVVPGDRVVARVRKVKKNYAEAQVVQIIEPSPRRILPQCQHFEYCGGCKWQNLPYETQLQYKFEHVKESLEKLGRTIPETIFPVLPSPQIFGYRNKMEFSFSARRWLVPEELKNPDIKKDFAIGFHLPGAFDKILDIQYCWLQSELLNNILNFSRAYFRDYSLPVFHLRKHEGILRFLVLRESFSNHQVMVNIVTFKPVAEELTEFAQQLTRKFPQVTSVVNNVNSKLAQIAVGEEEYLISGEPTIREKLGDITFEISANSFFQTNSLQAYNLYQVVREYAQPQDKIIWDLYSGTGSIALFLAKSAKTVIGFEVMESAVKDALRNVEINGITNCEFLAGDVRYGIRKLREERDEIPDVVVCDPPRAGLHTDTIADLLDIGARKIVYVSCNPTTLARDLHLLGDDYQVKRCQPVDMFPHTYHIETVVELVRK